MSSRPAEAAMQPDGRAPDPGPLSEQALADLERRRNLVASELSRLSAALDEALSSANALHVDAPWDPAPPPATGSDATEQLPRLRVVEGGVARTAPVAGREAAGAPPAPRPVAAGVVRPGTPAVVASGTPAAARSRRAAMVLAALGVTAVALLAVVFVVQRGRGPVDTVSPDRAIAAVSEAPLVASPSEVVPGSSEAATAPPPLAPFPLVVSPAATPSGPLDGVLTAAANAPQPLPDATQALVARVPSLQRLSGPARAEEAADIYGLAVIAARAEGVPGPATALVEALAPEVTLDSLTLLAQRRPAVVGAGVAPLLDDFAALPAAPAGSQRARAQALLDAMLAGVLDSTISPGFCNVGARVLEPYLETA